MAAFLENLTYVDALGTFGTLVVVAAYLASQMRWLNSEDLLFPVLNLAGSLLIVWSLLENFNLASMVMEVFWIGISLVGILQHMRQRRAG